MPNSAPDLVGQRFHMLLVLQRAGSDRKNALWRVRCDCGNERVFTTARIKSRQRASCGCLGNARPNLRHGMSGTPIHEKWLSMRKRCSNPSDSGWWQYGGKGIRVCQEWDSSFEAFLAWSLANGYEPGLDIDRIDPTGNYEPANCRYITPFENRSRTRRVKRVCFGGELMSYAEAERRSGVDRRQIGRRIARGYTPDEAWRPEPRNPKYSVPQKRNAGEGSSPQR
jgi:hypothetical protein